MNYMPLQWFRKGLMAGMASFLPFSMFSQPVAGGSTLPNILLILADDLGFGDLSCQGATDLRTPHIDRIFNQGMRLTSFYSNSTVCSPTRASLLTGCYPDMVGVPGVIRTIADDSWGFLSPEAALLPEQLKKAGYQSVLVGKWHLGLQAPNLPNLRGFDQFHGFLGDMMEDYFTHLRHGNNYMRENQQVVSPQGHATDVFTDWALEDLKSRKSASSPFFMYLSYNAPHDPVQPPDAWLQKVKAREKGISDKRARLVALIEHMDWSIGRVMDELEKSGRLQHTIVVFTSDNGGVEAFEANNGPYRGGKQDLYEGGIRVPAAFFWKDRIAPGTSFPGLAMTMDLFPTLCEIAGVKPSEPVDGISLLPALLGKEQQTDNRTVFFVRREGNMKYGGMAYYAARSGEYKILQNTPWEPMQLFNLREDPYEQHPLPRNGHPQYDELFRQLTRHIRLSGSIPWQQQLFK